MQESYLFHDKYMHWLFQLYTSNVYYVSSLIHFQLRLKGPCTFRARGTWGAAELDKDTQHSVWTRLSRDSFGAAAQW